MGLEAYGLDIDPQGRPLISQSPAGNHRSAQPSPFTGGEVQGQRFHLLCFPGRCWRRLFQPWVLGEFYPSPELWVPPES